MQTTTCFYTVATKVKATFTNDTTTMQDNGGASFSFSLNKVEWSDFAHDFIQTMMAQVYPRRNKAQVCGNPKVESKLKKVTPAKLKVRGDANENVDTNNSEKSVDSVETAEVVLHDRQSQSQIDIAKFNFGDFNTGSQYDVVINKGGEIVPIQAPKLEYYNTPKRWFYELSRIFWV